MNIEEEKLQALLSEKRKHFKTKQYLIETLISGLSFIFSLVLSKFWEGGLLVNIAISFIAVAYFIIFIICIHGANYSPEALYRDICLTSKPHDFSLIVIKNDKSQYLLKYNKRWKCYLLPFCKTPSEDKENGVIDYCKSSLNLDKIKIIKHKEDNFTKRSVSANLIKNYHHHFYQIECTEALKVKDKFRLNKEKYKWFTIEDMKCDKNIKEKNIETIEYIELNF